MTLFLFSTFLFVLVPFLAQSGPNPSSPLNDDVLGLIVFKADVADPLSHLASWNEDSDHPCAWSGVTCDPRSNRVVKLSLTNLSLSGKLSRGLLLLEYLKSLDLSRNNLTGPVQPDLLKLRFLESVDLSENGVSGELPGTFFEQCRSVRFLSIANNRLSGPVPDNVGACSSLATLNLSYNRLSGVLPGGIWNLVGLRSLDLSDNELYGAVPSGMNTRSSLRAINLRNNRFTGELPGEIGDLALLKSLDLSNNLLNGTLPDSIGRLAACQYLSLSSNSFSGIVPIWIGGMRSLESLDLSWNRFSGEIPNSMNHLHFLREVRLSGNSFTGGVPPWVFTSGGVELVYISDNMLNGPIQLTGKSSSSLRFLDLSGNALSGWVPPDISYLKNLQLLNLSRNLISGDIPATIGDLKLLEELDLSLNHLNHTIPSDICELASLKVLNLEKNSFYGEIPTEIGKCTSLVSLDLSENSLTGRIPLSISNLTNLQRLDLSRNKLSGGLPKQLSGLSQLTYFNVSSNQLTGGIPSGNFFDALPPSSLSDNAGLCGAVLNVSCPAVMPKPIVLNPNSSSSSNPLTQPNLNPTTTLHHKKILSISTLVAIGGAAIIAVGILTITVLNFRVRSNESRQAAGFDLSDGYLTQSPRSDANSGKLVKIGSGDLEFSAAGHALLNKDCELGRGGFGTVYKTVLRDGQPVAIKKLTVSSLVKSKDDFEREVHSFGKVKHHNLVELKGYYWTSSLQLLIYDYVPGGNLYKHLHESSASDSLSWLERFDIILGVAKGIAYLHRHGIVHYNIKSTNVLLDGSGEPKVADYGLAKLLPMLDRYVLCSKIQSALGYMAPEFACKTVKITEKCDVFGFGVLVLETLTGRRPVEYLEDDVVVLCDVVRVCLEEGRVEELIDPKLGGDFPIDEAVPIVKLGLVCTSQVPSNRPDMCEVVKILELIRSPQGSPVEEMLV